MLRVHKKEHYLMQRVRRGVDGNSTSVEFDHDTYKNSVFFAPSANV